MTEREKLLELVATGAFFSKSADAEKCVDYLLANGVAFANDNNDGCEWIPSLKRQPERGTKVWCAVIDHDLTRHVCRGKYDSIYGWRVDLPGVNVLKVTHWKERLPLPTLPPLQIKEEA